MNKPNFIIVGAAKSGTTSLYNYLKQHPEIFLSDRKEPLFFISDSIKNQNEDKWIKEAIKKAKPKKWYIDNFDDYIKLFESVNGQKAIGEASATYLYYYKESVPKISKTLGDIKIIIVLRNPVEKAFSQYKYLKKRRAEQYNFKKALKLEEIRIKNNYCSLYHYTHQCLYYDQVKAYMDAFSNIKVILSDDLKSNTRKCVREFFSFLNVDTSISIDCSNLHNKTEAIPRSIFLHDIYTKILNKTMQQTNSFVINGIHRSYDKCNMKTLNIRKNDEKYLKSFFRDDIERLENLIKRDLSEWK